MRKRTLTIISLLLIGLILVGASCGEGGSRKKSKDDEEDFEKYKDREMLEEPDLECWPIGSGIGESGYEEDEYTNIFGDPIIKKCRYQECETPEGMEWMTVVNYFKDKMESADWIKSGGQNIYYTESGWQEFTVWYQGQTKEKSQHYKLEYCEIELVEE